MSYAEQLRNPRGISTDEMEKLLEARARGERQDTILLDIRETAETEMGTMPGAKIVRFPGRQIVRHRLHRQDRHCLLPQRQPRL